MQEEIERGNKIPRVEHRRIRSGRGEEREREIDQYKLLACSCLCKHYPEPRSTFRPFDNRTTNRG